MARTELVDVEMSENKLKFTGRVEQQLYEEALKGEDTDVELRFGGPIFPVLHAHRAVLVSGSNVFKAMLKDCWKRKLGGSNQVQTTVVDLPVDNIEDFKTFLEYLYGVEICPSDCLRAVPAYSLADKYEAMRVMKCCEDFFFESIPGKSLDYNRLSVINLGKLLVLSKTCHNEGLFPHVLKQVMKNIDRLLVTSNADWLDWEESTLVAILEADVMKKFPKVSSQSGNEMYLLRRAIEWIEHQSAIMKVPSNTQGNSNAKVPRVIDFSLAVRILQKIRFRQMKSSDFKRCLQRLAEIFPVGQIGQISLQYSGMRVEKLVNTYGNGDHFILDTRKRDMHSS